MMMHKLKLVLRGLWTTFLYLLLAAIFTFAFLIGLYILNLGVDLIR